MNLSNILYLSNLTCAVTGTCNVNRHSLAVYSPTSQLTDVDKIPVIGGETQCAGVLTGVIGDRVTVTRNVFHPQGVAEGFCVR